jgi:hypothetical protein
MKSLKEYSTEIKNGIINKDVLSFDIDGLFDKLLHNSN